MQFNILFLNCLQIYQNNILSNQKSYFELPPDLSGGIKLTFASNWL
ncbi:hypothetical protein FEM08_01580 [Flavobacterium gilvum]|nr:hypothetical protein FEM08_01580 [Flavobacterium gilvum]